MVWMVGCLPACGLLVPVGAVERRCGHVDGGRCDRPGLRFRAAYRRGRVVPTPAGGIPEVGFEDLADVHAARHAEGVQDDVDGGAVREVGHVLDRQDLGDDALVAVTAGELVALGDLPPLGHVDADQLVDTGRQLVGVLTGEDMDVNDLAVLTVGDLQRRVAHLAGLLAEDGAQQALFGRLLRLALGGHLADEDVARLDLGADTDDAPLVEVGQDLLGQVRDVPVISSAPSLVSRASTSCSSMWMDVNTSSLGPGARTG